jgi:hypothetical protein
MDRIAKLQDDSDKHWQLIDLASEQSLTLRTALVKIRDLAKAGRLDEIFTLANRALSETGNGGVK